MLDQFDECELFNTQNNVYCGTGVAIAEYFVIVICNLWYESG